VSVGEGMSSPTTLGTTFRVGRKLGRTIYFQYGPEPSDDDTLIGMMDSADVARAICVAMNQASKVEGLEQERNELEAMILQHLRSGMDATSAGEALRSRFATFQGGAE
jgi:hypothetical protein